MAYKPITGGRISGIDDAMSMLEALAKATSTRESKKVLQETQAKGFAEIRQAIYGGKYGTSLATVFRKTRPRRADNRGSVMGAGKGTPVKTGRLQKSLTTDSSEFSIYSEQVKTSGRNRGIMQVIYGGDPVNPRTGARYFEDVESKFNFFADGIKRFEKEGAMKKLGESLAYIVGKALQQHISRSVRSARRR
jgi:hypothetical protein